MLTERYSAPSLEVFFQAAPISDEKASVIWKTRKSGALSLRFSCGSKGDFRLERKRLDSACVTRAVFRECADGSHKSLLFVWEAAQCSLAYGDVLARGQAIKS